MIVSGSRWLFFFIIQGNYLGQEMSMQYIKPWYLNSWITKELLLRFKNTNSHKVYYLHKIALMIFLLLNCCAYINAIFFYLSMIYELLLEFFLIHVPVRDQKKIIRCVNISICVIELFLFFKIVPILLPIANQAVLRILFVAMEI